MVKKRANEETYSELPDATSRGTDGRTLKIRGISSSINCHEGDHSVSENYEVSLIHFPVGSKNEVAHTSTDKI